MTELGVCKTQAEVCDLLGVSTRTLRDWLSRGCPGRPGRYRLGDILVWHSNVILGVCHECRQPLPKDSPLREPRHLEEEEAGNCVAREGKVVGPRDH